MSVTVERNGNEATIKLVVPAAEVNAAFAQAVQRIAKQVNIPGFRKGKAPRAVLETHVGKDAVKQEAFEIAANKGYIQALKDEKLIPVADPQVKESKFEENQDMDATITVTLKPEPELGDYKGLEVEKPAVEVDEKQIDNALEDMRKRAAKMVVVKDANIEKGDFAIIDFAGTVDGKPFSGGEGKGYPLEVGSGSFIPGFEDQLLGLKAGGSTDVNVTFPEDYFVKELAGKAAVFKVNVQDVKRRELPELNDELVAANSDCKTVEELKAKYHELLTENAKGQAESKYEHDLIMKAVDNAKFEVPACMIEDRVTRMLEELQLNLEQRKMNLDMYMKYTGQDMTQLRDNQKAVATENVKTDLVLDAVAKAEGLEVSKEDVEAELVAISAQHGAKLEDVRKILSGSNRGLLLANILRKKAAKLIVDSAKK